MRVESLESRLLLSGLDSFEEAFPAPSWADLVAIVHDAPEQVPIGFDDPAAPPGGDPPTISTPRGAATRLPTVVIDINGSQWDRGSDAPGPESAADRSVEVDGFLPDLESVAPYAINIRPDAAAMSIEMRWGPIEPGGLVHIEVHDRLGRRLNEMTARSEIGSATLIVRGLNEVSGPFVNLEIALERDPALADLAGGSPPGDSSLLYTLRIEEVALSGAEWAGSVVVDTRPFATPSDAEAPETVLERSAPGETATMLTAPRSGEPTALDERMAPGPSDAGTITLPIANPSAAAGSNLPWASQAEAARVDLAWIDLRSSGRSGWTSIRAWEDQSESDPMAIRSPSLEAALHAAIAENLALRAVGGALSTAFMPPVHLPESTLDPASPPTRQHLDAPSTVAVRVAEGAWLPTIAGMSPEFAARPSDEWSIAGATRPRSSRVPPLVAMAAVYATLTLILGLFGPDLVPSLRSAEAQDVRKARWVGTARPGRRATWPRLPRGTSRFD